MGVIFVNVAAWIGTALLNVKVINMRLSLEQEVAS